MNKPNYKQSESYDCFVNSNEIGVDLVVYECGYEKCEPLHCWGPEERPFHIFHYVESGKGKLFYGNNIYEIQAGEIFYLHPHELAYYEADVDTPWEYKWVAFNGFRAEGILEHTAFSNEIPVQHCPEDKRGEVVKLFDDIFQSFKSAESPNLLAVGHLYLLLGWLTIRMSNTIKKKDLSESNFYSILRYIQLKYTKKLQVADISKSLNYDRTYIYKLFMKYVGISPSEYIEGLRVKLACELIRTKKYSMLEIANKVGFEDYNWFFNVFKRNMNVSPNEYQEMTDVERLNCKNNRFLLIDNMQERYYEFMQKYVIT